METWEVISYTAVATVVLTGIFQLLWHWQQTVAEVFGPPPKKAPQLSELLARMDSDIAAVIKDAQAIRDYGASLATATGTLPSECAEQAMPVNAR